MNRETLSFLIASIIMLGVFLTYKAMQPAPGRAYASISPSAGITPEDHDYSSANKREIRRTMLDNPENVLQLTGRDIVEVLAAPELIRRDAPTIIWQYRNAECVLDLYFTTAQATALDAPVMHYEIRARAAKGVEDKDVQGGCVSEMVKANSGLNLVNIDAFYKAQ